MNNRIHTVKNVSGFTLVELIVVIAIIGALTAILLPSAMGVMEKANNAADTANARAMCTVIRAACLDDTENLKNLTKNPWGSGVRSDGTAYAADDHGYIYVTHSEVRVSSYSMAKLLEKNGFITSAGPKKKEIQEYKYPASQCRRMLCKSKNTWYRYQVNIYDRGGFVDFSYSACARATEVANYTDMSSGNNKIDMTASKAFASRCDGPADERVSLG